MKGNWIGKYWYSGNVLKNEKIEFELFLENHVNSKITGKITDNIEMGGTVGVGRFSGTIKGNKIKFVKRMPIRTSMLHDGTIIEEEKPHRPIYYEGIIDSEKNWVQGTWKFKIGIGIIKGRFVFYPGTKGKWEMGKANNV